MKNLSRGVSLKFALSLVIFLLAGMSGCVSNRTVPASDQRVPADDQMVSASGQMVPEICGYSVSPQEIRLDIDFSNVNNPQDYRYALYRAEEPSLQGNVSAEKIFYYVGDILPAPGAVSQYSDTSIKFGNRYSYQVFGAMETFPEENDTSSGGRRYGPIFEKKIPRGIFPQEINAYVITLLAGSPAPALAQAQVPPGIYVGIIKFSDTALEITAQTNPDGSTVGTLVPLDTKQGTDALIERFRSSYKLGSPNTALYHAVHRAVVSIDNNIGDNKLPADIDSINVIILTHGPDNSSANPSRSLDINHINHPVFAITHDDRIRANGYPEFLKTALAAKIGGIPITTWTFGIEGEDGFNATELRKVSNMDQKPERVFFAEIGALTGSLQEELKKIPAELNKQNSKTVLTLIMPPFEDDTKISVRYRGDPVITGTIRFRNEDIILTEISATPQSPYKLSVNEVKGVPEGGSWAYEIVLNDGPSDAVYDDFKVYRGTGVTPQTEAAVNLRQEPSINRKSSVVYFVLDSSQSIGEAGIGTIRNTIDKIIHDLFDINVGLGNVSESAVPDTGPIPVAGLYQEDDIVSRLERGSAYPNWNRITFDLTKSRGATAVWNIVNAASNGAAETFSINVAAPTKYKPAELADWLKKEAASFFARQSANGPLAAPGSRIEWMLQGNPDSDLSSAIKHWRMFIDSGYTRAQVVKANDPKGKYTVGLLCSSEREANEYRARLLTLAQ
jgi:hypothetical protein